MPHSESTPGARHAELILHELDSLPTLPGVAARLIRIGSVDDADFGEIIRLIQGDPALTARLLSLCRRAEHGLGSRITTVERAAVLLGLDAIQSLVLSVHIFRWQADRDQDRAPSGAGPGFDRTGFWKHSIGVACAAEAIAAANKGLGVRAGEAFVGGLLHDLGKLALDLVLPRAYTRVVELTEHRQCDIADTERTLLNVDHHTAGKRLAERWQLPPVLGDVMWLHGQSFGALPGVPHRNLIGIVALADALCRTLHVGFSGNHAPVRPLAELCGALKLDPRAVEALVPKILENLGARCHDLGLTESADQHVVLDSLQEANKRLSKVNEVMERRSRLWREQSVVLEALLTFHQSVRPGMSVIDVLAGISASVGMVLGSGRCVLVFEPSPGEAWTGAAFDNDSQRTSVAVFDPPAGGSARAGSLPALAAGNLPALLEHVREHLRSDPLPPGPGGIGVVVIGAAAPEHIAGHVPARGSAVLLHTSERALGALGKKQVAALVAAWSGQLACSMFDEQSRRLGEQLAESNRVLAQTQLDLAEAQSMARLGELTAGAAHEMGTPLAVISARCQMLAASVTDPGDRAAALAAVKAAARLNDLVSRLHQIAKPPRARLRAVSMPGVIAEAVRLARSAAAQGADAGMSLVMIRTDVPENMPEVLVDPDLLAQAVGEIIRNAIESGAREPVDVSARVDPVDDYLVIEVIDTGCGMSEHALEHAFDPFFSEKAAGRQPGLGLSSAAGLIRLHEGSIALESLKGAGTTARICLPKWRAPGEGEKLAA